LPPVVTSITTHGEQDRPPVDHIHPPPNDTQSPRFGPRRTNAAEAHSFCAAVRRASLAIPLNKGAEADLGAVAGGHALDVTPRPKEIPAWDDQSADAKRVYIRLMENYAAYLAYADDQIGRLIDSIEQAGELDNTLTF
jgi:arylsulfatase A-like enzyme